MALRGKPLPFAMKLEIKQRHSNGEPLRRIAESLQLDKKTAQKYGTKPLLAQRESAK